MTGKVIWDSDEAFLPGIGRVVKGDELKCDPKLLESYIKQRKAKLQKDKAKEGDI